MTEKQPRAKIKKILKICKILFILWIIYLIGIPLYYTPYELQPSYWEFKKMCELQYDFYEKGVGNEEFIDKYRDENGFNEGIWYNGRYEVKGHLSDLYLEEQWINCDFFYKEWDKEYLSEQEQDLKFFKGLMEIEEKGGNIKTLGWDIEEVKKKIKELEISIRTKVINNEK